MEIRNERLSDDEFFKERREVLADWPSSEVIDLDEAVAYQKSLPPEKKYALKVEEAKKTGVKLLHGASGADTLERHIELIRYLQDEGKADIVSTWTDALTRNHRYDEVDKAVAMAESTGKVVLNGFPIAHYGVAGTRRMTESIHIPACVYANSLDIRLIGEIALAGGHTGTSLGGSLYAFWWYTDRLPPERVMRLHQYYLRLQGYYEEKGVPILAKIIGCYSGLIPPSLKLVPTIIDVLMAAEQGVKNILLQSRSDGNLIQDVASAITMRKMAREYLDRLGYTDVRTYLSSHHPYGKYPEDDAQAYVILGLSAINGVLADCEVICFNTVDEGRQIPRKEQNAATHRYIRMMLNMLKDQEIDLVSSPAVREEAELIEREVRAILDKTLEMGDGDVIVGASRAIEAGVLDEPYSTTRNTRSLVMAVRDSQGAVRYLDHGNLPFDTEIVNYHKEKVAERARKEGREITYDAVIGDIYALSRGQLISSPSWRPGEAVTSR